jgi:hypothetical protein
LGSTGLYADNQAFDLLGPKVDVHVKRGVLTLPISEAPNLMPGDRLWIHPDLPVSQSAHYVLIVAFLRGATNPPPPEWFTRVETWTSQVRSEGVFVTVPTEAQQALLFLLPETGGDFTTLRKAVHDRPGSFIRAAQDLQTASWQRMRVEAYLAQVKITSQTDMKLLKERTELTTRSLGIKLEQQCFDKPTDQQAPCLAQNAEGLVMDDTSAQSRVEQLASGSAADLMSAISSSSMAGGGAYSPYIGAIVDTAKILGSLHTAHFQYIPALALPTADTLNLRLNVPPSFRNPKSVVVVALPPLGPTKPQPLHPVNMADNFCAQKPGLVLPAEGAPLVFSTQFAHNLTLHIEAHGAEKVTAVDLPVNADPAQGGLVLVHPAPALPEGDLTGVVRGKWGFDDWEGPRFRLRASHPGKWTLTASDQSALVVGREDTLHIEGDSSLCVEKVELQPDKDHSINLAWKSPKPATLEVTVPLKDTIPGPVGLAIYQYGMEKPDKLDLKAYAEAASLDRLTLSAGDPGALLKGKRLDEVAKAELEGITLTPAALSRVQDFDQLAMTASGSTTSLVPGKHYVAHVELRDGRQLRAAVTVEKPRPQVELLNKGVQEGSSAAPSSVQLGSANDLPVQGRLVFFLKSTVPANFPRDEKVEVAAVDGSFHTVLSLADGSLMLEDAKTAMGNLEPLARFGSSAFGPVHLRVMSADGITGDWLPLGTLVRIPGFRELHCPHAASRPCTLTGSNLFLIEAIAATPQFDSNPTDVAPGFTGTQLTVPHPANGVLYLKLRDDPATVQTLTLTITTAAMQASEAVVAKNPPESTPSAQPASTPATQPDAATSVPADPAPDAAPATAPPAAAEQGSSTAAPTKVQK